MSRAASAGTVLRGRWKLTKFLAQGACGEIWECEPVTARAGDPPGLQWVAKVIKTVPAPPLGKRKRKPTAQERVVASLNWEAVLYKGLLRGHTAIPRLPLRDDSGEDQGVRYLVMQKLGKTLTQVMEDRGGALPPSVVASYGIQMVRALREVHNRKLLFVDVKPENFMLGLDDPEKLYILDFGAADKYIKSDGSHKPIDNKGNCGTPSFMSLRVHQGTGPSRRDDIESLGFVLLFLLNGKLPWDTAKSDKECLQIKEDCDISQIAHGPAGDIASQIIADARDLPFDGAPDYKKIERLLQTMERLAGSSGPGRKRGAPASAASPERHVPVKRNSRGSNKAQQKGSRSVPAANEATDVPDAAPAPADRKRSRRGGKPASLASAPKKGAKSSKTSKTPQPIDISVDTEEELKEEPSPRTLRLQRRAARSMPPPPTSPVKRFSTGSACSDASFGSGTEYTSPTSATVTCTAESTVEVDYPDFDENGVRRGSRKAKYTATVSATYTATAAGRKRKTRSKR